jgi:hypothetical protein
VINYYSKKPRQIPAAEQLRILGIQRKRAEEIQTKAGIEITPEEFNALPKEKYGFEWIPLTVSSGPPWASETIVTGYRKGKSVSEIKREISARASEIQTKAGIEITLEEFSTLPKEKYGFEWIPITVSSGPPWASETIVTGYRKGKSVSEIKREISDRIRTIQYTPDITITVKEFGELPPDKYGYEWIPLEVDYGSPWAPDLRIEKYRKGRSNEQIRRDADALNVSRSLIIKKDRINSDDYKKLTPEQQILYIDDTTGLSELAIYRGATTGFYIKKR